MSWKMDELGAYDDDSIPEGLELPIAINEPEDALTGNDGVIVLPYAIGTNETSIRVQEKRKAEFVMRLANGELIVRKDKSGRSRVFKRAGQSMRNGRIVIEFEEVRQLANA